MSFARFMAPIALLVAVAYSSDAADLTRLDRRLVKEPAYQCKNVRYALLVFGPEAKTRLWLALDGDTLYADRNGNGDLTDPGEKIEPAMADDVPDGELRFKIGDVRDGERTHKELMLIIAPPKPDQDEAIKELLAKDRGARTYRLSARVVMPGRKGPSPGGRVMQRTNEVDAGGVMQFAATPREAPVVHFAGPLRVALLRRQRLVIDRQAELTAGVGTPGTGPGTMAWVDHEGVLPEGRVPVAEVCYPPEAEGARPLRERYALKRRCLDYNLDAPFHVPAGVGAGSATITLRFDSWPEGRVAESQHEVAVAAAAPGLTLEPVSPRLKGELIHPDRSGTMLGLHFSPDGKKFVASNGPGGVIAVWDVGNGKELVRINATLGHRANQPQFFITPDFSKALIVRRGKAKSQRSNVDGKLMDRFEFSGEVLAWDLITGRLVETYRHSPRRDICIMELSPDGKTFTTFEFMPGLYEAGAPRLKQCLSLWDVKTGGHRPLPPDAGVSCHFSPDGKLLAAVAEDISSSHASAVKVFDVGGGKEKWSVPVEAKTRISIGPFSRDGKLLLARFEGAKSQLRVLDAATGREVAAFEAKNGGFASYQFSPDGKTLAAATWSAAKPASELLLFRLDRKQPIASTVLVDDAGGMFPTLVSLGFSPNGKVIAAKTQLFSPRGGDDPLDQPQPRIHLVDAVTGKVRETIVAPQGLAFFATFSPDGRTLATGGHGRVLLWDVADLAAR